MELNTKRRAAPSIQVFAALTVFLLLCVVLTKGLLSAVRFMNSTGLTPTIAARLILDDGVALKSSQNRTNILLLGVGGGAHEGADLTDTMVVVSLDSRQQSASLISIPRDIWSDTLKDRVNSAYHYGEEKKEGGGLLLARVIAEDVIGAPIHYTLLVDFSGFKDYGLG